MAPSKSLLSLPEPPDFLPNVLAAVERDWLSYAAEELLAARWVTITSIGGHRTVRRQLDNGRNRRERGGHLFDEEKGLHRTWDVPSSLILTVQDMAEAVYKHWLARPDNQPLKIFCRKFYRMYEGTREEDLTWIVRRVKYRTREALNGALLPIQAPSPSPAPTPQPARLPVRPSFDNLPRRVASTPMITTTSPTTTHTSRPTNLNPYIASQTSAVTPSAGNVGIQASNFSRTSTPPAPSDITSNSANCKIKEALQIDLTTPHPTYRQAPSPKISVTNGFKNAFASSYATAETSYMGSGRGKVADKESPTRSSGITGSRTVSGPAGFPDTSAVETPSKRPASIQKWLLDSASKKSARKRPMLSPDLAGNSGFSPHKESPSTKGNMNITTEDAGYSTLNLTSEAPTRPKRLNASFGDRDVFGSGGNFGGGFESIHSKAPSAKPGEWSVDLRGGSTSGSDRHPFNPGKDLFGEPLGDDSISSFSKAVPTRPMGFDSGTGGHVFSRSGSDLVSLGTKTTPSGPESGGSNGFSDSTSTSGIEKSNGHTGGFGNRYYSGIGGGLNSTDQPEILKKPTGYDRGSSDRNTPRGAGHANSRGGNETLTGPLGYRGGRFGKRNVSGPAGYPTIGNGKTPPKGPAGWKEEAPRTDSRAPHPDFGPGGQKENRDCPTGPHYDPRHEPRHQGDWYRPTYNQGNRGNRNDYDPRVQPTPGSRYDYRYKHGE